MESIIINAQEAKNITSKKKKTIEDIFKSIRTMAEAGKNFSVHQIENVLFPSDYAEQLSELGFTVKVDESFFSVSW